MTDISSIERRKLERLFRMGSGYVLDFSDRTFSEFFEEHTRRDIDAAVYRERGASKANRLRGFWAVEGNHLVGKVIQAMILYGQAEDCLGDEPGLTDLTKDCWTLGERMLRMSRELMARADLGLRQEGNVVVMNRRLKNVLEAQSHQLYSKYTDDLQTIAGVVPDEVRWLAMYRDAGWAGPDRGFWARYAVLTDAPDTARRWIDSLPK